MATDDIQIQVAGTAPVPLDYRIPGNGQLRPKAVTAVFDGSGAAGAFLPTVEIVSDGGVVVARCPAGSSVAAGASAEVSWFPGVAAAAASSASVVEWFFAKKTTNLTLLPGGNTFIPWTAHETSNASLFSIVNTFGLNTTIQVAAAGVCLASVYVIQNPFNAAWPMHVFLNSSNAPSQGSAGYNRLNVTDGVDPVSGNPYNVRDYRMTVSQAAPFQIYAEAVNDSGVNQTLGYMELGIFYWPNSTLFV